MIYSMTGYGKGVKEAEGRTLTVEMKSVNQRFLDLTIKLPRNLLAYEDRIRKTVSKSFARGKMDIFVTYVDLSSKDVQVIPNEGLMHAYIDALNKAADEMGLQNRINSTDLLRIPDLFTIEQKDADEASIEELIDGALEAAINGMTAMRKKEGEATIASFRNILADAEKYFENIKERAPKVPIDFKVKFTQRIKELMEGTDAEAEPQRIATEIAVFADKACIDEEITRFSTHISHFYDIIESSTEPVGKKLDFLIQEMNREVNTMGSKANDITITENVIALKSEIEKLREQVQNLE